MHADFIPGLKRSSVGGNGNPLQYSCLENPMDRGAWWAAVHGVAKSQTELSTRARSIHMFCNYSGLFKHGLCVEECVVLGEAIQGLQAEELQWSHFYCGLITAVRRMAQ